MNALRQQMILQFYKDRYDAAKSDAAKKIFKRLIRKYERKVQLMDGQWTFNKQKYETWPYDEFGTKEEAVKAALEYAQEEGWVEVFVGQISEEPVPCPIDSDTLIEKVYELIDEIDNCECNYAENFSNSITDEQEKDLQPIMEDAFYKWVEKHGIKSHAYTIVNIEKVPMI